MKTMSGFYHWLPFLKTSHISYIKCIGQKTSEKYVLKTNKPFQSYLKKCQNNFTQLEVEWLIFFTSMTTFYFYIKEKTERPRILSNTFWAWNCVVQASRSEQLSHGTRISERSYQHIQRKKDFNLSKHLSI